MDIAKKSQYLCRQKEIDLMKNMNIKSLGNAIKGHPTMTEGTVYSMLIICGISHFLNDMIQSIIPSIYPIIKEQYGFTFAQIGIITLIFQMTSSILQPFTGLYADKHPRPYALSIGMCFTVLYPMMKSKRNLTTQHGAAPPVTSLFHLRTWFWKLASTMKTCHIYKKRLNFKMFSANGYDIRIAKHFGLYRLTRKTTRNYKGLNCQTNIDS